jgi:Cys-tRNA(Pro)/Cys-tRNA(Cys) deacylase
MQKTNAIRLLESNNIPFLVIKYDTSDNEIDAISVANKIKENPETVFKTLVAKNENNIISVFVIPGSYELNSKKAALASNSKKIEMIKVKELLSLTGYIRGECSPIGMRKTYQTFIDESAQLFDHIFISAGKRGMQIKISPSDLNSVVKAKFIDLIL